MAGGLALSSPDADIKPFLVRIAEAISNKNAHLTLVAAKGQTTCKLLLVLNLLATTFEWWARLL